MQNATPVPSLEVRPMNPGDIHVKMCIKIQPHLGSELPFLSEAVVM